jgi:hypothetical protein
MMTIIRFEEYYEDNFETDQTINEDKNKED